MITEVIPVAKLVLDAIKLLDGKYSDRDQSEYKKLLRRLANYRLLTSPYEAELAGAVIASAEELRKLLTESAVALPTRSGVELGVLSLGRIVRGFLTNVDQIEFSIRRKLDLIAANSESGVVIDDGNKRFLDHWKRRGYPEQVLRNNHRLNVMEIQSEGQRIQFLLALGTLRGQFGLVLSELCQVMSTELPEELGSLTPEFNELTQDG